jgi:hypothetical protein
MAAASSQRIASIAGVRPNAALARASDAARTAQRCFATSSAPNVQNSAAAAR